MNGTNDIIIKPQTLEEMEWGNVRFWIVVFVGITIFYLVLKYQRHKKTKAIPPILPKE